MTLPINPPLPTINIVLNMQYFLKLLILTIKIVKMRGWICIVCIFLTGAGRLFSQNAFEKQLNDLLAQPEYRHALAGIQITDANRGSVVYEMNSEKLFIPASVIKL